MSTIEQFTDAARKLTADQLRERLAVLDKEERLVRALLRATLRSELRR